MFLLVKTLLLQGVVRGLIWGCIGKSQGLCMDAYMCWPTHVEQALKNAYVLQSKFRVSSSRAPLEAPYIRLQLTGVILLLF